MGSAKARVKFQVALLTTCVLIAGCTASVLTVTVSDEEWSADTIRIESSSSGVPLMITNATNEDQSFLVINLWEGAVDDLPLTPDGLLDLTMANVSFDQTRPGSRFGLIHPEGVGADGSLPILLPGGTVRVIIGPSGGPNLGTYLVMSGEPNALSTGRFAQFEIGQPTG
jgi:hypothetical protein